VSGALACFPMRVDAELAGVLGDAEAAYPAPEVSSLAGLMPPQGWPAAVESLAAAGSVRGWDVRRQWARGCLPHATTGAPGAVQDSYAVRFAREGWGAWTVRRGAGWPFVWMWGLTLLPFGLGNVTDLKTWLTFGGTNDPVFFDAIRVRVAEQEAARKAAALARPRTKREGMS